MGSPQGSRKAEEAKRLRENLRALTNVFRDRVEQTMWPQGMTVAQLRMLYAVQMDPEGSSASIARQCQVTPQTLQAMLQRAAREGWIVRKPAANNARILTSSLTPKGKALLAQAKDEVAAFEAQIWRDASTAQLQGMNAVFAKALQRIEQAAAREPVASVRLPRNSKPKVPARR